MIIQAPEGLEELNTCLKEIGKNKKSSYFTLMEFVDLYKKNNVSPRDKRIIDDILYKLRHENGVDKIWDSNKLKLKGRDQIRDGNHRSVALYIYLKETGGKMQIKTEKWEKW